MPAFMTPASTMYSRYAEEISALTAYKFSAQLTLNVEKNNFEQFAELDEDFMEPAETSLNVIMEGVYDAESMKIGGTLGIVGEY